MRIFSRDSVAKWSAGLAQIGGAIGRLGRFQFFVLFSFGFASATWLVLGLANGWDWHGPGFVNTGGANIGRDFVEFWSAGKMVLSGHPASPYDHALFHAAEIANIGAPITFTPWFYPPPVLFFVAPLALLPYLAALVLWLVAPLIALLRALRPFANHSLTAAAGLIFPGTVQSLLTGQNGVLSTLIVVSGLANLEKRPVIAGMILGTLSYKPQMAIAAYAALLFGRYWRSLGVAIATAAALCLASLVAFGIEPWTAFIVESGYARELLETGEAPWDRLATVFTAARLAGVGVANSYLLQSIVACVAFAALFIVWRRQVPIGLRAAVLAAVIPLTTPYAHDYDLVIILPSLLWLVRIGLATGFRRGECAVVAAAWAVPVLGWLLLPWVYLQFTPIVLLLLLLVILRRASTIPDDKATRAKAPLIKPVFAEEI